MNVKLCLKPFGHSLRRIYRAATFMLPFTLLATSLCGGASEGQLFYKDTGVVDGLFVRVMNRLGSTPSPSDQWLCYGVYTTNTDTSIVYLPKQPEYAYQIELLNTNGVAVPKTELGKKAGTRFIDLDTSFSNEGAKLRMTIAQQPHVFPGKYLFRPDDLFEITTTGNCTLQIRFQIIVRNGTETNRTARVVRFPRLDYPIVKSGEVNQEQ